MKEYIQALQRHCRIISRQEPIAVRTIYIGGGTPSVLDERSLKVLLAMVKTQLLASGHCQEFTMEVNPETATVEKLQCMRSYGVNRISVGVQSFQKTKCAFLQRTHQIEDIHKAIIMAESCGFDNISIDLIYGVYDETVEEWESELYIVKKYPHVRHVSAYALTIEKNTPFYERSRIQPIAARDTVQARMFKSAMAILPAMGFSHYEISNFAQPGYECAHNQAYWDNDPYIGLGAAAVSYDQGVRSRVIASVREYIDSLKRNIIPYVFSEKLSSIDHAKETACLQIRRSKGICFNDFLNKTGFDLKELKENELKTLMDDGLLKQDRDPAGEWAGVFLTDKGFVFCDSVCEAMME